MFRKSSLLTADRRSRSAAIAPNTNPHRLWVRRFQGDWKIFQINFLHEEVNFFLKNEVAAVFFDS